MTAITYTNIKQAKENSENFEVIFKEYYTPVFRFISFKVSSREEAEDLTQDVFTRFFSALQKEKELSISYLYTIARNRVIDYYRKKKAIPMTDELEESIIDQVDYFQPTELNFNNKILGELLKLLSPSEREVIIFKFMDEYDTKTTALLLGKSEDAVRKLQSRAIQKLRNNISKYE